MIPPLALPVDSHDFEGAMSEADFAELRSIVYKLSGISLSDSKRTMLASRITTRLRQLGLPDFKAYRARLATPEGFAAEQQSLINAVTTNKTGFFREGHQFEFIGKELAPLYVKRSKREIYIWSAACSTGQEPWTIAMVLAETLPQPETWSVRILATDIDTEVLSRAEKAVYKEGDLDEVSADRRARHFEPDGAGGYRVKASLRKWVSFRKLNFMDEKWPLTKKFDFIMCRNASIYFDPPTQQKVFSRLCDQLDPSGWLFVGHAEVLSWAGERLEPRQGGIYRLRSGHEPLVKPSVALRSRSVALPPSSAPSAPAPRPSRPPPAPLPKQTFTRQPVSPGASEALEVFTIHVGEAHTSTAPVEIKTLLGSCVAACLYDPVARIGGMNHFLLPHSTTDDQLDRQRFGAHAMETLINALMNLGADRRRLKGKLFGGGNVLPNITRHPTIGEQNASFAENFLRTENIELVASRLGGETGVEVRFHPHSGRAFVRDISRESAELRSEENKTMVVEAPKGGDAELF